MKLRYHDNEIGQSNYFETISFYIKNNSYQRIGSGSSRSVYDLNNGKVVKAAKNIKGIAQNIVEYNISEDDSTGLFADVREVSDDFRYLIMDKANRIDSMAPVWDYYHVRNNRELFRKIGYIASKYNLMLWDLGRAVNWGQIDGRPVVIDYGFTKQVSRRYYRRPILGGPRVRSDH